MAIKDIAVYNEPAKAFTGDVVPRLGKVAARALPPIVRARLQLEADLRTCGVGKPSRSKPPPQAAAVVLRMLGESDSPLSASLRARAAALAGPLKVKAAAPMLRRMALDESEDLLARVNAVRSYVALGTTTMVKDLDALTRSKTWQVRAVALAAGMKSPSRTVAARAATALAAQRSPRIKAFVSRVLGTAPPRTISPKRSGDATAED